MPKTGDPQPMLVVCVLHEPAYLDDVLAAFLEAGVTSATVLESQGMGRLLSRDMPIFASFRHLLTGASPYSYTIMAPVEDPTVTQELLALIGDVLSTAPEDEKGFLFALPLAAYVNLNSDG